MVKLHFKVICMTFVSKQTLITAKKLYSISFATNEITVIVQNNSNLDKNKITFLLNYSYQNPKLNARSN